MNILILGSLTAYTATSLPLDPEGHEWLPPTATDGDYDLVSFMYNLKNVGLVAYD